MINITYQTQTDSPISTIGKLKVQNSHIIKVGLIILLP